MTRRKQWKAVTTDYTALMAYDNVDAINLCLTQREVAILKALLMPAYWSTRWTNLTISDDELNEMVALIDAKLDTLCEFPVTAITDIRQALCILEYFADETWTPFADLSICATDTGTDYYTQIEININVARTYLAIYVAPDYFTINIYAPIIIWNGGTGGIPTADRETALCMATQAYVGSYAARKVQELDVAFSGLFILIAGAFFLTGGIGILAGMFVGGAALVAGVTYTTARAALLDEEALLAVACCMYEALQGEDVEQATFQASLDSCGFSAGTNSAIVRDLVASTFSELESYLSFVDASGRAFVQVDEFGVDLCDCEPGTFVHTFDFLIDDGGWTNMASTNRPYGVWQSGVGWVSVYGGASEGIPDDERLYIRRDGWNKRFITRVELFYTSSGVQGGSSRSQSMLLYEDGVPGQNYNFGGFIVPDTWMETADPDDMANSIINATTGDSSSDNCEIVCTKIIMYGDGSDPF